MGNPGGGPCRRTADTVLLIQQWSWRSARADEPPATTSPDNVSGADEPLPASFDRRRCAAGRRRRVEVEPTASGVRDADRCHRGPTDSFSRTMMDRERDRPLGTGAGGGSRPEPEQSLRSGGASAHPDRASHRRRRDAWHRRRAGQGRVGRRAIPIGFEYRESRAEPARRSWKRPGGVESGSAARGGIGIRRPAHSGAALAVPMGCDVRQTAIRPAWHAAALLSAERTTRMCPGMMAAR